ncbi:unnamed protein product, partial [marine sediment metagenome]
FDWDEPQDLQDIHNAVLWGIFGSEISLFPYYLTQVNLLIQLTPVIRRILELTGKKPREKPTPLGVICSDSMELHNEEQKLFEEGIEEVKEEHRQEIIHLPIPEKKIHEKIRENLVFLTYHIQEHMDNPYTFLAVLPGGSYDQPTHQGRKCSRSGLRMVPEV